MTPDTDTEARAAADAWCQSAKASSTVHWAWGKLGFLAGYQAGRARGRADGMEEALWIAAERRDGYRRLWKLAQDHKDAQGAFAHLVAEQTASEIAQAIRAAAKGEGK